MESSNCNYGIFEFSKSWSENLQIGISIPSLGTNVKAPDCFLWSFIIIESEHGLVFSSSASKEELSSIQFQTA